MSTIISNVRFILYYCVLQFITITKKKKAAKNVRKYLKFSIIHEKFLLLLTTYSLGTQIYCLEILIRKEIN